MSIFNDPKIREYIEYIKNFDVYTKEEELEAFKKLKNGDSEIREDIILHNLRLVVSIASRYVSKNSNFSFFEVLSFGNEGLIYAIDKYDEKTLHKGDYKAFYKEYGKYFTDEVFDRYSTIGI